jgi:hypothetical protein
MILSEPVPVSLQFLQLLKDRASIKTVLKYEESLRFIMLVRLN